MTIEFYWICGSPPAGAVVVVARLIGVEMNYHTVNMLNKEHLKEDYLKINPRHKVPFMIDGDLKFGESCAIMAYLIGKYKPDDEHLYPKDPATRAKIDELLYIDNASLVPAFKTLVYPIFSGKTDIFDSEAEGVFKEQLQFFEDHLASNADKKFMLGDHLTIGDIAVGMSFSYFISSGYDMSEYKQILAYNKRLKENSPIFSEISMKTEEVLSKNFGPKVANAKRAS